MNLCNRAARSLFAAPLRARELGGPGEPAIPTSPKSGKHALDLLPAQGLDLLLFRQQSARERGIIPVL